MVAVLFIQFCMKEKSDWSPEAAEILFMSNKEGNGEIYVNRSGDSNRVNPTSNEAGDNWGGWYPDGNKIAFSKIIPGTDDKDIDIFAVSVADPSRVIKLVSGPEREAEGSWRPRKSK